MSLGTVIIKHKNQIDNTNENIKKSLNKLTYSKKAVPLIYDYLHSIDKQLVVDSDNKIGEISNIRYDEFGNIIGDITVFNILKLANNFQGKIDNIFATLNPATGEVNIKAFIVYDRVAKEELLKKKSQYDRLAKAGEIPFVSNIGPDVMKQVTDQLMDEYEKLVDIQQNDNLKEGGK